jgi:hypothetical protein
MPHRGLRVGVLSVGHTDPQNGHISSSDAISKEWISEVMYLMLSSFKGESELFPVNLHRSALLPQNA